MGRVERIAERQETENELANEQHQWPARPTRGHTPPLHRCPPSIRSYYHLRLTEAGFRSANAHLDHAVGRGSSNTLSLRLHASRFLKSTAASKRYRFLTPLPKSCIPFAHVALPDQHVVSSPVTSYSSFLKSIH